MTTPATSTSLTPDLLLRMRPAILLIDAQTERRAALAAMLMAQSGVVEEAASIKEGLKAIAKNVSTAVLVDVACLEREGWAKLSLLRGQEQTGTRVVIVLGPEAEAQIAQAFAHGASDVMRLPVNPALLLGRLQRHGELDDQRHVQVLRTVLDNMADAVVVVDRAGHCVYANPAAGELLGEGIAAIPVSDWAQTCAITHTDSQEPFPAGQLPILRALAGEAAAAEEMQVHVPRLRWLAVTARPLYDDGAELVGAISVMSDITQRKENERHMAHMAQYDHLTGLPNRHLFRDRLNQAIQRANRSLTLVGVMFFDLDKFKELNDTLGHAAGDLALTLVADRIRHCLRKVDTLARISGDEFTVVVEGMDDPQHVEQVSQKILREFAQPFVIEGHEHFLTASIGIAVYPLHSESIEELLKQADMAMYHAKSEGRNRYRVFDAGMSAEAAQLMRMKTELAQALDANQLVLHYQPQIDARTGQVQSVEALLRWRHPVLGLLPPQEFLSLAEETGLMIPIGLWVLETACAQCKAWQAEGAANLRVAVNLSVRQLKAPGFVEQLREILQQTGLNPALLELEITENLLNEDFGFSHDMLGQLKKLGIRVSVDDFGVGQLSLSSLTNLDFDILKMDGSFIRHLSGGDRPASNARDISGAIIALARSLDLKVVAECVEAAEQAHMLREMGCDFLQGFLFSPPVPAEMLLPLIRQSGTSLN